MKWVLHHYYDFFNSWRWFNTYFIPQWFLVAVLPPVFQVWPLSMWAPLKLITVDCLYTWLISWNAISPSTWVINSSLLRKLWVFFENWILLIFLLRFHEWVKYLSCSNPEPSRCKNWFQLHLFLIKELMISLESKTVDLYPLHDF